MSEEKKHGHLLTIAICVAIVLAIVVALAAPHAAMKCEVGGEVFLNLLKMLVVPLVMSSVMSGILGLGDVRRLGKPGAVAIGYYICTTLLAVVVGLVVVNLIRPGVGAVNEQDLAALRADSAGARDKIYDFLSEEADVPKEQVAEFFGDEKKMEPTLGLILRNLVLQLFTDNLFKAGLETKLLPLIVFSIIFAAMLTTLPNVDVLKAGIGQINSALMAFVLLLMKVATIGIFCLVTARFGEAVAEGEFGEELQKTGWYFLTILFGLGIHALVTLPAILFIVTRRNPYRFIGQMSQALLTAFSTASSSATLPVTMECAEEKAGISKRSAEFVLPLGATINMDGTALYEAGAVLFIAQALGVEMTVMHQLTIALTATLAAIGAAGIPEAGLVTLVIVLNAVGLPIETVGLILSVDWLLDRFRTTVNCYGDACGAAIVDRMFSSQQQDP